MTPLPKDAQPIHAYKDKALSICTNLDCDLSPALTRGLFQAARLYAQDIPKVAGFGAMAGTSHAGAVKITLYPADKGKFPPFSVLGDHMALTYVFDASGRILKKRICNR